MNSSSLLVVFAAPLDGDVEEALRRDGNPRP